MANINTKPLRDYLLDTNDADYGYDPEEREEKRADTRSGSYSMTVIFVPADGKQREITFAKPKESRLSREEEYDCKALVKVYDRFLGDMEKISGLVSKEKLNLEMRKLTAGLSLELSKFRKTHESISVEGVIVPKIEKEKKTNLPPPDIGASPSFFSKLFRSFFK